MPRSLIESLESRRLLAVFVTGTGAADIITMSPGGPGYNFQVNGQPAGSTDDQDIVINGMGGSDQIYLYNVNTGMSVTVRGGAGNDIVELGNGSLFSNLRGQVYIEELDGEGTDQLIANDSLDTTFPDWSVRVRDTLLTSQAGSLVGVHYDDNVENKTLLCSGAADTVYVESPAAGMLINLGGGDDTIRFGSLSGHDLPDFMAPATVNGGTGTDRAYFDDTGSFAPIDNPIVYNMSATRFLNQAMLNVEHAEFDAGISNNLLNIIRMTGKGGITQSIILRAYRTEVELGTSTSPVDLDDLQITFNAELNFGGLTLYDQDTNTSAPEWQVFTATGPTRQRIVKGAFVANLPIVNIPPRLSLHGGSTDDRFAVSGIIPEMSFSVYAGDGADALYTSNLNGHDNDLDAVFTGEAPFGFSGEDGYDFLDLDDSADQIGDGDEVYYLGIQGELHKANRDGDALIHFGGSQDDNVELVQLIADGDPNTIYFGGPGLFRDGVGLYIDGGAGNDLFTTYDTSFNGGDLNWNRCDATVIGGAGTDDRLEIDDTADNPVNSANWRFRSDGTVVGPSDIAYNSTMERVSFNASEGNNTIYLDYKPGNTLLTVNGNGGNDNFIVGGGDIDINGLTVSNTTVSGGVGSDSITFDDRLDDYVAAAHENETYTLENNTFRKDTGGMLYFAFESQTIQTADRLNGALLIDNTINLNNHSINFEQTTVIGGGVRGNAVHVSTGNITNLTGNFAFHLGTAVNGVYLHDHLLTQPTAYLMSSTTLTRNVNFTGPKTFTYSGVNYFAIYAGSSADTVSIESTPANMLTWAFGNGGNDTLSIGGLGGIDNALLGRVDAYGGTGVDDYYVYNANDPTPTTAELTNSTFRADAGVTHNYGEVESVRMLLGGGGSVANVLSVSVPATVSGGNGNDTFNIGNGNIDTNILGAMLIFGGGGNDSVVYDDRLDAGNDNYQLVGSDTFRKTSLGGDHLVADTEDVEIHTIQASGAATSFIYAALPNRDMRIFGNGGNDGILAANGVVTVDTGPETAPGGDVVLVNSDWGVNPNLRTTVKMAANDRVYNVNVDPGGTLQIPSGVTLDVTNSFTHSGILDMAGGAVILRIPGQIGNVRNLLTTGFANGAWNGGSSTGPIAINSSLAAASTLSDGVGYGLGSQIGIGSIGGFSISPTNMLIRYTLNGDANLNATVDISDLGLVATNWQASNRVWTQGDFNYSNIVDITDLGMLATNWQQSLSAGSAARPSPFSRQAISAISGELKAADEILDLVR